MFHGHTAPCSTDTQLCAPQTRNMPQQHHRNTGCLPGQHGGPSLEGWGHRLFWPHPHPTPSLWVTEDFLPCVKRLDMPFFWKLSLPLRFSYYLFQDVGAYLNHFPPCSIFFLLFIFESPPSLNLTTAIVAELHCLGTMPPSNFTGTKVGGYKREKKTLP